MCYCKRWITHSKEINETITSDVIIKRRHAIWNKPLEIIVKLRWALKVEKTYSESLKRILGLIN